MLNLRQEKHLANALEISLDKLRRVADCPDPYVEELAVFDTRKADKPPRQVFSTTGILRTLQFRLLRWLLVPKLNPSPFSHGGIRGRSILSNAVRHLGKSFLFTADISKFYPSIHYRRVYELFQKDFGCSPDVARLCTRLCTFKHHLALGLMTSPILADQILIPLDNRIGAVCDEARLVYSRFVDDLAISGDFDLDRSGFGHLVEKILNQNGFFVNPKKRLFGRISDGMAITKIRISNGHPDVQREFIAELDRQLNDAHNLAHGEAFSGPFFTRDQIAGRIHFVSWVNARRRCQLQQKFASIRWDLVHNEATKRGLVACKTIVVEKKTVAIS